MKYILSLIILLYSCSFLCGQGLNSHWLLGHDTGFQMGRIEFDNNSYQLIQQQRKMTFWSTQVTIADMQGNFLMSSNGVWIANASNDTMMNGAGLNPGSFVNSNSNGLPIRNGNLIIPFPGVSNRYVLFHQTSLDQVTYFGGIYQSVIDITIDGGLGGVILKNDPLILDYLTWGITATKHGNGRDWWVIAQKDSSNILHKMLVTPSGIESITQQSLGYTSFAAGNAPQITFSPNGNKLLQSNYDNPVNRNSSIIIADFDRCTGMFSNTQTIQLASGTYLWGLAFSPSGQYAYACTIEHIFQIEVTTLVVDTVAVYDGFCFPNPPWCTSFYAMYLAANGKIYITSGSGVQHIHEMNFPDLAGVACDVQQHSINLNGIWNLRTVPNHPNYYLGALTGSPCDTLTSSIELPEHDFKFSVSPNPSSGDFRIMYLLPQNQSGKLEIFDVNGRRVYEMNLPPWSTLQDVNLPEIISSGVYSCVVSSGGERVNGKIATIR